MAQPLTGLVRGNKMVVKDGHPLHYDKFVYAFRLMRERKRFIQRLEDEFGEDIGYTTTTMKELAQTRTDGLHAKRPYVIEIPFSSLWFGISLMMDDHAHAVREDSGWQEDD